ncbi:hypothetical protein VZT92_025028 [Zoarces viviparus]|uniref:Uncharacterized protein n=1 Tax=Zoarces viviparus TaxID=48416 RepID=A0AAW1E5R5_ZOAVI
MLNGLQCNHITPPDLPGGRRDEPGPRRPADERPHVLRAGPGQTEALRLPAAGPPQPAQRLMMMLQGLVSH